MRTAQIGTVLATGLLLTLTFAALPASAGCTYLLNSPTGCVTAIYENEKRYVLDTLNGGSGGASDEIASLQDDFDQATGGAGALQGYGGEAASHLAGCAGTEGPLTWGPGPAVDGNLAYVGMQQDALGAFLADGPASPFVGASVLVSTLWLNTAWVIESWDENVFEPLLSETAANIADLPDDASEVPTTLEELGAVSEGANQGVLCAFALPAPDA